MSVVGVVGINVVVGTKVVVGLIVVVGTKVVVGLIVVVGISVVVGNGVVVRISWEPYVLVGYNNKLIIGMTISLKDPSSLRIVNSINPLGSLPLNWIVCVPLVKLMVV